MKELKKEANLNIGSFKTNAEKKNTLDGSCAGPRNYRISTLLPVTSVIDISSCGEIVYM